MSERGDMFNLSLDDLIQLSANNVKPRKINQTSLNTVLNNDTSENSDKRCKFKSERSFPIYPIISKVSLSDGSSKNNFNQHSCQRETQDSPLSISTEDASFHNDSSEYNINRIKTGTNYSPYPVNSKVSWKNKFDISSFQKETHDSPHSINRVESFHDNSSENMLNRIKTGRNNSAYPINRRSLDNNPSGIRYQRSFNRGTSWSPYCKRNYLNNSNNRLQHISRRYTMPYVQAQCRGSSYYSNQQFNRRHRSSCLRQGFGPQDVQNYWRPVMKYQPNSSDTNGYFQRSKSCENITSASNFRSFSNNASRPNFHRNSSNNNMRRYQINSCPLDLSLQAKISMIQEQSSLERMAQSSSPTIKDNAHECKPKHFASGITLSNRFKGLYELSE